MLTFDGNAQKEYVCAVEDDLARFVGFRLCEARVSGFIAQMEAMGVVDTQAADALLADVQHLGHLAGLGRKYAGWCRTPPAELELLVLSRNQDLLKQGSQSDERQRTR